MSEGTALRERIAWMIATSDEFIRNGLSTAECLPLADRMLAAAGALAPAGLTAGQVDAVRAAVALGEAIRLHGVCGLTEASMVVTRGLTPGRIATLRALASPAADAAPGEPS